MKDLQSRLARGAGWMVSARLLTRAVGVVNVVILARLLVPADFGLVAAAWTALAFLMLFSTFDFEAVVVQKETVTREDYDTAFTLKAMFGAFVTLIGVALSGSIAAFFGEPQLEAVVSVLSFSALLQGLHNTGLVELRRKLEFGKIFLMDIVPSASTLVVTLVAAFILRSYWALVVGAMAGSIAGLALSYLLHPFRPRACLRHGRAFFRFSKWVFLNSSLHYLDAKFANVLVGKSLGTADLGVFRIGSDIAALATTELAQPINRVLFPGYSRVSGNPEAFRRHYLDSVSVLVYLTLPVAVGIMAVAEPLVSVLLGAKWEAAVPVIAILALRGALRSMSTTDYAVYMAAGRPEIILYLRLPYVTILLVLLFTLTSKFGVAGAASAFLITEILFLPLFFLVRFRTLGIKFIDYSSAVWRSVVGVMGMFFLVTLFLGWSEGKLDSNLLILVLGILIGLLSYLGCTVGIWLVARNPRGGEALLWRIIFERALPDSRAA
jgi:lipopolysaccharide exporter